MSLTDFRFGFNRLEDEVRGIDLTVRMRIGDTNHFALVLEDQDMIDARALAQILVLSCQAPIRFSTSLPSSSERERSCRVV
jgi:hypothetical protein